MTYEPKKIIVAGSRDYTNVEKVFRILDTISEDQIHRGYLIEIVSGLARGPDMFGKAWAEENNFTVHEFPANWEKYGKKAGFLRNKEMAEFSDVLLAFHINKSRGTMHMINLARELNLKTIVITK